MLQYDSNAAVSAAKAVRARLAGRIVLSKERQSELLQAYVQKMNDRGQYVRLLTADAQTARCLISGASGAE
eukprot:2177947-Pleurochrysis_carterae.AAC.1